jgi:fructose-1,6-bisphosphatase
MDSGSALNSEKVELKAARNLRATNTSAQQLWHLKVAMFYKKIQNQVKQFKLRKLSDWRASGAPTSCYKNVSKM